MAEVVHTRYTGFLILLIGCALILSGRLLYLYLADAQRFPIHTVKVTASYQHISHKQLETLLANYSNTSFFLLPMRKLSRELKALEWTKEAYVNRLWPDTVKIKLIEKEPFAVWNDSLLTAEGDIFNAGNDPGGSALPHLHGPENQQKEVLQVYQKLSKILSVYGLTANALVLRNNRAWELILANGVRLRLGKQELNSRILRFCKAYATVFAANMQQVASVDLRYPHGMAVQWKK